MKETYCGKNCDECAHREPLQCAGCKDGPSLYIPGQIISIATTAA